MSTRRSGVRELVASVRLVGALVERERLPLRRALQVERELTRTRRWQEARRVAAAMRRTHRSSDPADALKYLDVDQWLRTALRRAARLQLIDQPPLRIVDLGVGAGIFAAVCQHFGHTVTGVDLPVDDMPASSRLVYQRMTDVFEVPVQRARIVPGEVPPLGAAPELVTAFMITFNGHRTAAEWGLSEWTSFVQLVRGQLAPDGRLHLELNPNEERFGGRRFYDAGTEAWFRSIGWMRQPGIVTIPAAT
jgi:hypothetical protein